MKDHKLVKAYERAVCKVGSRHAKIMESRIRKLCSELKKHFPTLNSFTMGNGYYWFNVDERNDAPMIAGEFNHRLAGNLEGEVRVSQLISEMQTGGFLPNGYARTKHLFKEIFTLANYINDCGNMPNISFNF